MKMTQEQLDMVVNQFQTLKERSPFYAKKYADIDLASIRTQEDFEKLPFTEKADLREAYPMGLAAVPQSEIVRIHSSSGTTGTPVIIPYTQKDIDDWAIQFARCFEYAGCDKDDVIQVTPGYGLWTAGCGFQAGVERLGAMCLPMGPGNTPKQLQFMQDFGTTTICATSSFALLMAEEIKKQGLKDKIQLKRGVIGSERWGEKMRKRISEELGIELYDIYGLTEVYGPGIGINCKADSAMHIWADYVYVEIVDPETGELLPDGEEGEIVLTTLQKEGAPLIRFRTHDLSRIVPGECECGSKHPRIDIITGRTDDMVKVRGCNIFPALIEECIAFTDGCSSEYQVYINNENGRDNLNLYFESDAPEAEWPRIEENLASVFKAKIGMTPIPKAFRIGDLPRSEKKTKRIFDDRY